MWAAGLERSEGYKEEIREELLRLVRLTETPEEFIAHLSEITG